MDSLGARGRGMHTVLIATVIAAALILAGRSTAPPATAQERPTGNVHVATSGLYAERVKTIPIAKRPRGKKRVVMALGPRKLRRLRSGDLIEGKAEVEVSTTCVRPRWWRCVGRRYRFSPTIAARLVLASGPEAVRGPNVMPLSGWTRVRCSQHLRHRNHHCVLRIPTARRTVPDVSKLPCRPRHCRLSLMLSAHHPQAKRGQRVVIGVDARHRIVQNKGQLSVAIYRPWQVIEQGEQLLTEDRVRERIPVGPRRRGEARRRVVYSQRLDNLRAGEQLVVDARAVGRIGHLSYNTLVQSKLVLSRRPDVPKRAGAPKAVGTLLGRFGPQNGFNCTQGRSAHSDPCVIYKAGVMRIVRDARQRTRSAEGPRIPLYVNLVVGTRAVGIRGHRRRKGHGMQIGDGGFLRVHRYGPGFRRSASPVPPAPPDSDDQPPSPFPPLPLP